MTIGCRLIARCGEEAHNRRHPFQSSIGSMQSKAFPFYKLKVLIGSRTLFAQKKETYQSLSADGKMHIYMELGGRICDQPSTLDWTF